MTEVSHRKPEKQRRRIPEWLLGLIIAAALFIVGVIIFSALGFGDDPVIEQSIVVPLFAFGVAKQRLAGG